MSTDGYLILDTPLRITSSTLLEARRARRPDRNTHGKFQAELYRLSIALNSLEGLRARIDLKRDYVCHSRLAHFNETKIKASIAAGAKFGEHKTSPDTATKKLTHLLRTDVPTPSYRGDKYFIHFTDDKTRHTVPYALRKKSDYANALHTTPPYDKKAGGSTSESLILSGRMSWPYYSRTARAAQIWPIVLKTVAIIYNNMTHGATDKIPSIELFRSADDLSRSALSAPHLRVHTQAAPQRNAAAWEADIYLGFKDAHGAYVYDPVTDTYTSADIAFSPSNSPRVPTTPSRASTPHRPHGCAVEGGGGDGLDEVDKFIHDALNQAPPTRVVHRQLRVVANPTSAHWASTVTANGWSTTGCTSASRG
ncbi:hypothetical protein RI054_38g143180 [Pseudoscourfieldia marina]